MAQLRAPTAMLFVLRSLKSSESLTSRPCLVLSQSADRVQCRTVNTKLLPGMDRYTKRKSEFRIPGMSDQRVRERHILLIPGTILSFLCGWMIYLKIILADK